jgi:GH24 family phage-related lysozyme (muramidase)
MDKNIDNVDEFRRLQRGIDEMASPVDRKDAVRMTDREWRVERGKIYERLQGEWMARNTSNRYLMSKEDRRLNSPMSTGDVDRYDMIYTRNPDKMYGEVSNSEIDGVLGQFGKETDPMNFKTADEFIKAQGTPVYHGGKAEVTELKDAIKSDYADSRGAMFASSDMQVSPMFGKVTTELYPSMKNPYVFDAKKTNYYSIPIPKEFRNEVHKSLKTIDTDSLVELVMEKGGHDGIILKNVIEGTGEFDPSDARVLHIGLTKDSFKTKQQLTDTWNKAHKVDDGVLGQKTISNADKDWFKPSAYKNVNKDNIVYLTPQEFLDFASPVSNKKALTGKKANVDKLVTDGTQFDDLPYLQISDKSGLLYNVKKGQARVTGHDGRHRVMALAEQGVEKIPVVLRGDINKAKLKQLISQNGKATSNFPGYTPSNKGKAIVGGVLGALASSDSEETTETMNGVLDGVKETKSWQPQNNLLDFVKNFENAPLAQSKNGTSKAYKDYDTTSQGFGSEPKKDGSPMTKAEANKAVIVQLINANKAVDRLVKIDLNEHQRNALVSMLSNVKTDTFAKSNALKELNKGNIKAFLKEAFDPKIGFVKAGGKISNGLVRRRAREKSIFTKGNYGN